MSNTTATSREVRVVEDNSPTAYLFDTARFEHMQRIATAMASASLIPKHLRGNNMQEAVANCFLVVNQSIRWNLDPFAVAPETYEVGGKLGYQGKLVAAVVNTRAGLDGRLQYTFEGSGDERTITVSGRFKGDATAEIITLRVKDAKTDNKMWIKDPDQKLVYSGAVKWARRHCPEIVLGVITDDDLERIAAERAIDVTPPTDRPKREDFIKPTHAEAAHASVSTTETQVKTFPLHDEFGVELGWYGAARFASLLSGMLNAAMGPARIAIYECNEEVLSEVAGSVVVSDITEAYEAALAEAVDEIGETEVVDEAVESTATEVITSEADAEEKPIARHPFWDNESRSYAPKPHGKNGYAWSEWADFIKDRAAEAISLEELNQLANDNRGWLNRFKVAQPPEEAALKQHFRVCAAVFEGTK